MISTSRIFRRGAVLAFVLFIMAALAASVAVSLTVAMQLYPSDVDIAPGTIVHDVRTYCFLGVCTSKLPDSDFKVAAVTSDMKKAGSGAIVGPTAVTLSSMSAQSIDHGTGWAMPGLGALGIGTLGGLLFVVARKR